MDIVGQSIARSDPGLFLIRHLKTLFEATRPGLPILAPPRVIKYARRFYAEVRRCEAIQSPSRRKHRLNNEAVRFRNRAGWRAEFRELADAYARALTALSNAQERGYVGNPRRRLGETTIPERRYVNRAIAELDALASRLARLDWMQELRKKGEANRPSRGRALVKRYAIQLAEADSVILNEREVSKQIREYVKTAPPPPVNALIVQEPRRRSPPQRRPIKAAGT